MRLTTLIHFTCAVVTVVAPALAAPLSTYETLVRRSPMLPGEREASGAFERMAEKELAALRFPVRPGRELTRQAPGIHTYDGFAEKEGHVHITSTSDAPDAEHGGRQLTRQNGVRKFTNVATEEGPIGQHATPETSNTEHHETKLTGKNIVAKLTPQELAAKYGNLLAKKSSPKHKVIFRPQTPASHDYEHAKILVNTFHFHAPEADLQLLHEAAASGNEDAVQTLRKAAETDGRVGKLYKAQNDQAEFLRQTYGPKPPQTNVG
ncbi:hypothetical protein FRB93_003395 [Tulasnella sp. JGI-2019a]|nr:hypothetical protein FRB93_003395 [Tulasnella sp. JGI-2019a]